MTPDFVSKSVRLSLFTIVVTVDTGTVSARGEYRLGEMKYFVFLEVEAVEVEAFGD